MNKKRYIYIALIFVFTLLTFSNVKAVDYGWIECDGHRWTPESDCRVETTDENGNKVYKLKDNATTKPGQLKINFDANGKVTGVETDPFPGNGVWISPKNDGVWVRVNTNRLTPIGEIKDFFSYITQYGLKDGIANLIRDSISTFTIYCVNFSPLEQYYQETGHAPKTVVAEKLGTEISLFDALSGGFQAYVYHASDLDVRDKSVAVVNIASPIHLLAHFYDAEQFWEQFDFFKGVGIANFMLSGSGLLNPVQANGGWTTREVYYFSSDLSDNADINTCDDLDMLIEKFKKYKEEYGNTSTEYKELFVKINEKCEAYLGKEHKTGKSVCFEKCSSLQDILSEIDPTVYGETNECGFGQDMIGWLIRIFKIIRYIVPIIVIVTSTIDYIGALASESDDAMKKAGSRFSKRLLIMIIIFLVPALLQFIFNIFKIPGLNSSNPYCLK